MAYVVGVAGGTCTGKTTLLRSTESALKDHVAFISLDDYFVANAEQTPLAHDDWEHPGYLRMEQFTADLQKLRLSSNKLVIVEGYLIFHTSELRSLIDLRLFINLPEADMVARRLNRIGDKPWDQPEYIRHGLVRGFKKYVEPQRQYVHHELDGLRSTESLLKQTLDLIKNAQNEHERGDYRLDGFLCRDAIDVNDKLVRFANAGPNGIHTVFDFDRTMTTGKVQDEDVTTWHILDAHLPRAGQIRSSQLFQRYRSLELEGTMTSQHAYEWWSQHLDLFVEYHASVLAIENTFLDHATVRPGMVELFKLLEKAAIPTVVLSAGIKEIIQVLNQRYSISPSHILATHLQYLPDGRITGWDKKTLVHALNKLERGHEELSKLRATRPFTLLLGDGLEDARMAQGDKNVLRIRIYDPRKDETDNITTFVSKSFAAGFDLVIGKDITPIVRICKSFMEH